MTIVVGAWVIPILITIFLLAVMLRPYQQHGDYDFGAIFRVLWLIPILLVWIIYLSIIVIWRC